MKLDNREDVRKIMEKQELQVGDVVQINPEHDPRFAACFMTVTEVKPWGAQGYIQVPGGKGQAYYRCNFDDMEYIGRAMFVQEHHLTTAKT